MAQADEESDPRSLVGEVVAERYQVETLLGAGAMGMVYRARHIHMQKHVALKVLHRETSANAEVVSRFEREAVASGRVMHPNVAGATDFGRLKDGSFYLVLEYVEGQSLGELLAQAGRLPAERAVGIVRQILSALSAAHRAEIVHRDLKPENVMLLALEEPRSASSPGLAVSAGSSEDVVKVLDFGLAKLQRADPNDTQLTMAGAIYGTPQYMSPEQAAGAEVDHRADLYAVGIILYEMLAGHPPFEAEQMMPLLLKHMTEAPPRLPNDVPRALRRVVERLLEKEPERRFQSAEEALLAVGAALLGPAGHGALEATARPALPSISDVQRHLGRRIERVVALSHSTLSYLQRDLEVGGLRLPRWMPVSASLLVAVGALGVVGISETERKNESAPHLRAADEEDSEQAPLRPTRSLDADLLQVLDAAKAGSEPALYALEHRADSERSDVEWGALAHAYLMRRDVEHGLRAFGRALDENREQARDLALLGALRFLTDEERFASQILEFVSARLGSSAPDFLFDVWSKTSAKTAATERAHALLRAKPMSERWSPALKLALELRTGGPCQAQLSRLDAVIQSGDERSLPPLRDLKKDRACSDAATKSLEAAMMQASLRKAPRFPLLRRWRWTKAGASQGAEPAPKKKLLPFL